MVERLLAAIRSRARPTRERGRPARIRPGMMERTLQRCQWALKMAGSWAPKAADPPRICFGWDHAVPAGGVGGCHIVGILSGSRRNRMRAGRPRSQVGRLFALVLLLEVSMGIENCRVLGAERGNRAKALLWPGTRRSRRQGGRLPHRRRIERLATAVHAGETPALPGGASRPHTFRRNLGVCAAENFSGKEFP